MITKSVNSNVYGVLYSFDSTEKLLFAVKKVRELGFSDIETYSPFPIHGMDDAMGLKQSVVGWLTFLGGALGLIAGFGLQTWAQVIAYPYIISGKPFFSYPAFIPVTFELMVLFAAFATVIGMFALNGLPRYNHPIFESVLMKDVTSHSFVLFVSSKDKKFQSINFKSFSQDLSALEFDVLENTDA